MITFQFCKLDLNRILISLNVSYLILLVYERLNPTDIIIKLCISSLKSDNFSSATI